MNAANLYLPELKAAFSRRVFFGKADLRNFYRKQFSTFSETTFRSILYTLEKQAAIIPVDVGVYRLSDGSDPSHTTEKFVPTFSDELRQLYHTVQAAFPYTQNLVWETRLLHEFMLHQPGQSQVILETERDACESVFNFLNARLVGRVFLCPDRLIFERYILPRPDRIIITPLFTQSPHQKVEGISTPRLEKILVDIFANEELFYVFHGEELTHIFESAFARYQIGQKALFRYARRRKIDRKIRDFILKKTRIQLIQLEEPIA